MRVAITLTRRSIFIKQPKRKGFQTSFVKSHLSIPATRLRPSFANDGPRIWRAQGKPGARRTRSLVCEMKKHTSVVTTGSVGFNRLSPRNGFTAYFVLSLVTGLVCHHRKRNAQASSPT